MFTVVREEQIRMNRNPTMYQTRISSIQRQAYSAHRLFFYNLQLAVASAD